MPHFRPSIRLVERVAASNGRYVQSTPTDRPAPAGLLLGAVDQDPRVWNTIDAPRGFRHTDPSGETVSLPINRGQTTFAVVLVNPNLVYASPPPRNRKKPSQAMASRLPVMACIWTRNKPNSKPVLNCPIDRMVAIYACRMASFAACKHKTFYRVAALSPWITQYVCASP